MIKNYFKIAFRNLSRNKAFSFINIFGLAAGLTTCILIGLFVWDEYQYDRSVTGGEQVYRVYSEYKNNDGTQNMAATPPAFATTLLKDFPEVEKTARVMMQPENKRLFEAGNIKIYESSGYIADSTFFEVFPLPFKYGSASDALNAPTDIILSDEFAQRLFGNENPVGKQLILDKSPLQVKGVFKKDPKFHIQFNYMLPLSAIAMYVPASRMESWVWHQFITYAKLKKGTHVQSLQSKFQKEVTQLSKSATNEAAASDKPIFQPLADIHLHSADFKFDIAKRGNITYVNALTIIAVFVLLIACFNFVNLATAKSLQRAKEVGVRKTIGAGKKQLVFQFIGETIVLAFISIIVSVCLASFFLPWMNSFTGKTISIALFANPVMILLLLALTLLVGVLAGFYPAIILSNFKPVKVLKGSSGESNTGKTPWLRHSLVVLQFSLSALLIICAIVVFNQVNYLHNKDLGFNKEQIMFFPMRGDKMTNNVETFKNELAQAPGVSSVSIGYGFPGDAVAGDEIIVNKNGQQVSLSATQLTIDFDYIKTLGLQVIAGRDFSKTMGTDKDHAWIINETAVKQLGFGTPEKALGKTLSWHPWGASNPDSLKVGQVIGVVK
ncbi:MAG: ABC transporter permease, partial [Bacteroidota bacterium]